MQTKRHLFLIGFMGCGKSHWGRLLAEKRGVPFLDLDDLIAAEAGKSIADIFAAQGEESFRALEREALRRLPHLPQSVIATGGGTPCFFDNMDWMNKQGSTVYLKTAPTLLVERLRREKEIRPLLAEVNDADLQSFIEKKLAEREPHYLQATMILEQTGDNDHTIWHFLNTKELRGTKW